MQGGGGMKVSVIVPVYNTEKYLRDCLESLVNQTIDEIEIIVINDGSTDNSLQVIKSYKERYNNIILIDKKNEGQGKARNIALDICMGEYISFVDSDDYIDVHMLEDMYSKAKEWDLDIVVCNYTIVHADGKVVDSGIMLNNSEILNEKEVVEKFLTTNIIGGFSWNKIFKRKLFANHNIRYPEKMKYEDMPMVLECIINSNRIGFLNNNYYYYIQHDNSTTNVANVKYDWDYLRSIFMIKSLLAKYRLEKLFSQELTYYIVDSLIGRYNKIFLLKGVNKKIKDDTEKLIIKSFNEYSLFKLLKIPFFSRKKKLWILLLKINLLKYMLLIRKFITN